MMTSGADPTRRLARTGAVVLFAGLTVDVVRAGPLATFEQRFLGPLPPQAGPWAWITRLGSGPVVGAMTVTAAMLAVARGGRPLRPAAGVLTGVAARAVLMQAVSRERPPRERWRVHPDGPSYPSRHVTWCTLGVLALLGELPCRGRGPQALAAAVVAVECYSRVRLGVHWPSDVVAGVLLALIVESPSTQKSWEANRRPPWPSPSPK